jgi:hypothetical protein
MEREMVQSIEFYQKKLLTVKPNTIRFKFMKFMIQKLENEQKGVKKSTLDKHESYEQFERKMRNLFH